MLRFTPTAWAKLQFFCHYGQTEIGGFGVTAPEDPLLVEDFITVKQAVTAISVAFDDLAVADYFEQQVDQGRKPEQFARIWLHTHPGSSPTPSSVDERTFARVFGRCDWAVMFILANGGATYARLRFNVGPGGEVLVPVDVEYTAPFAASDHGSWLAEYEQNIHEIALVPPRRERRFESPADSRPWDGSEGLDTNGMPVDYGYWHGMDGYGFGDIDGQPEFEGNEVDRWS